MTARLKRKAAIMIVVELIFLSLVGVLLTNMQTDLSLNDQRDNIAEKLDEMDELIAAADASGVEITEAFDEENRGKAAAPLSCIRTAYFPDIPAPICSCLPTCWTWTM